MNVSVAVWAATLAALLAVIGTDLFVVTRRPHKPSHRESTAAVLTYIGLAVLFGVGVMLVAGHAYGAQFFAGWLTEYSLSVDNLFIFVLIMTRFRVPEPSQRTVLVVGILLALVFRGVFIGVGAAAIARFSWVFYLFGLFLIYTAVKLLRSRDAALGDAPVESARSAAEFSENGLLRLAHRVLPTSETFEGNRLRTTVDGRRLFTPLLIVMIAIGSTDVLFALDSIPAIFGLTQEPYLVFTANAFALMGLLQLYFLLGGLLDRLVYLDVGLAVVLGFIGVSMVLEALHGNELPFLNDGAPVSWAPELPIVLSLGTIVVILAVTAVASLRRSNAT